MTTPIPLFSIKYDFFLDPYKGKLSETSPYTRMRVSGNSIIESSNCISDGSNDK
jgi:hypothetical protein